MDSKRASYVAEMILGALCIVFGFFIGFRIHELASDHRLRMEAAEAGAGQWTVDPVSGETTWQWNGKEVGE